MQKIKLQPGETIEPLERNQLRIIQDKHCYCFSLDSILLSKFVRLKENDRVIDLGTGCAIIPLMIYDPAKNNKIFAVEIQKNLADIAERNISLNHLEDKMTVIQEDMRAIHHRFGSESFDVITANPPYIPLGSGKRNLNSEQFMARHEINISMTELLSTCHYLLKKKGRLYLIHRADRLVPVIVKLKSFHLEPKTLQFVYTRKTNNAKRILIEARKEAGTELKVLPPQILDQ